MPAPGNPPPNALPPDDPSSSRLTAMFLVVAALTTVVGFAAFFATWLQASIDPGQATLQVALKQYGLSHFSTAADLAEQADLADGTADELIILREYLIGAGRAGDALPIADMKQRRSALHIAIPHLQVAAATWPTGREDEGDRLLGLSLFHVGDYAAAIGSLRKCIDRNPTMREELVPVLAQCYLYGEKASAQVALEMLNQLGPSTLAPVTLRNDVECLRAQCLLRLSQYEAARQALQAINERISPNQLGADDATLMLATKLNLLLAVADVSEAIDRFGRGKRSDAEPRPDVIAFLTPAMERLSVLRRDGAPDIANQASLWAARGHACSRQPAESLGLLTTVRQQQPFEGANIAAGIEEIEWLADAGNGEEMLQTMRYLLREIGNEQNFDGSAIDLPSFRGRFIAALQTLRQQDRFDHCVAIARVMPSLFLKADAHYEEAITHLQAAERLVSSARRSSGDIEPIALVAAKKKYLAAGDAFAASAKLRFDTAQYCDTLWQAIQSYQSSGQFAQCVELLDDYLLYEDRRRQPRALLAIGKARLATGETEKALLPLETCIVEFPRDPLRYDARLYAALAHAELQRFDAAKELLDENLTDGELTSKSEIWRDSLFTLGELLFRQSHETYLLWELGDPTLDPNKPRPTTVLRDNQPLLEEAILKLGEAVKRSWPDPRAKHAAYLQARAHRLAAVWPQLEAQSADVLDAAKRQLRQQADQHLTAALTGFINLRRDMATREEEQSLSESQQAMLRNCYVAEADTLFDLGRYEQAAEAFRAVSLRYMNEPPALEAMLGQARCLRQLNRTRDARQVIRQAAVVLSRIPPEADDQFIEQTRYDRKRWQELLTWLDSGPMPEDSEA